MSESIRKHMADSDALTREKGFRKLDAVLPQIAMIAIQLINSVGEIAEMWEAARAGKLNDPCDKAAKMGAMGLPPLTCLEEEMADRYWRLIDDAVRLGVDLPKAIEAKYAYNATRPEMHGGKAC